MGTDEKYREYASKRLAGGFGEMNSWQIVAPRLRGKRTLDVGCSDGLYLRGLSAESVGVEHVHELAAKARETGHDVVEGDIETVVSTIDSASFDAVLASHVLEHLKRPMDMLEEMARILRPAGLLILGLPTERNVYRNLLRMDYYDGTHLYSFTTRNIQVLLRRVGLVPDPNVVYHLPKLRGSLGIKAHRVWNALGSLPGREFLSLAYWQMAAKPT
jgi:SAM-dependent methyltransferase